ncbi:MAG TPA: VOC family protein [Acidimicrobiales bacterium]|nr:VOC family protein [Acidimicrobiales bacterium]
MGSAPRLKVTGINHVVLHVKDLGRSKGFYMEVLGFEDRHISAGPMRASFLRCGEQGLDLFEVSTNDVHGGEEMNHMALCVEKETIDEIIGVLAECGIATSERTPRNTVFISDPDGHRIEMLPRSASERSAEREAARTAPL